MPRSVDWERVARATLHPLRVQILDALAAAEAPRSPVRLSEDFGEPLGSVSYHMGRLKKDGLVKLVGTEQRRGALMHLYALAAVAGEGE